MAKRSAEPERVRAFDSLIMPRLEIDIPMPPGAAIPPRAIQTPPPQISPAQSTPPIAAQPR
jgi:hypothetical protein